MGQYYHVALLPKGADKPILNGRKVEGCGYIMAKLREHGYLGVKLVDAVAKVLAKTPSRLAWVGDYANEKAEDGRDEVQVATGGAVSHGDLWGDSELVHTFPKVARSFNYKGKYLVNHTKKAYIAFDSYIGRTKDDGGWTLCPFTLLTAIGNGRGGGDYWGENEDLVGTWAWDEISIERKPPKGYEALDIAFKAE